MPARPQPPTDPIAARDRALLRLRRIRMSATALALAMVVGFSVLAVGATPASSKKQSAVVAQARANAQAQADAQAAADAAAQAAAAHSTYSAPTSSSQSPTVVSGGS